MVFANNTDKIDQQRNDRLVELMLKACFLFVEGKLTLDQLERRIWGSHRCNAIQQIKDDQLNYALFALQMDFLSWKGYRDDIIATQAEHVVALILSQEHHS